MNFCAVDIETKKKKDSELTEDQVAYFFKTPDKKKELALHPMTGDITCVGFYGVSDGKEYSFVLRPEEGESQSGFARRVVERCRSAQKKDINLVWQRGIFDLRFLSGKLDFEEDCSDLLDFDTRTMAHTSTEKIPDSWLAAYNKKRDKLNKELPQGVSHRAGSKYSLKCLAPYFLGVEPFWEDPRDHDSDEYVIKDCKYAHDLCLFFIDKLKEKNEWGFYFNKARLWDQMLVRMSCNGITLAHEKLKEVEAEYTERMQAAEKKLDELWAEHHIAQYKEKCAEEKRIRDEKCEHYIANRLKDKSKEAQTRERYRKAYLEAINKLPRRINYGSDKQMLWLLRDKLGYNCADVLGDEGTGKDILEVLAATGHEDVAIFLEWRKAQKVVTSYFPSYKALSHKGKLYPFFNSGGARTGRLSSSNPNLQQVPPDLYRVFKPTDGHNFIGYDMDAIEAKIIAILSEDPVLLSICNEGLSIHDYNTKNILFDDIDCEVHEVKKKYPEHRVASKKIGFTLFYGGGQKRVVIGMSLTGFQISEDEGRYRLKKFREEYEVASEYHLDITAAFENKVPLTNLMGRPLIIENKKDCYMKGFNTMVQSSASDMVLQACYHTESALRSQGIKASPIALIHDFIMFEAKEEDTEKVNKILVDKMTGFSITSANGHKVDMKVEGFCGKQWKKD